MKPSAIVDLKASYLKRPMNADRLSAIEKFAGRSILDAGCGSGAYVLGLKGKRDIRGVDGQSFESWAQAPELFSVSDVSKLDLPDGVVDTVLSFETLEHLDDPEAALKEYLRVCRKNVILTVPNCDLTPGMERSNLLYSHWSDRTHVQFFDLDSIKKLVESCGFKVTTAQYINEINPTPFVLELFGLSADGLIGRLASKALSGFRRKRHAITCLVVGEVC